MLNSTDLGRGFLKLQEDNNNSSRSSSFVRQNSLELNVNGIHYVTRINCGFGRCIPCRVKVEKDDGGLRIGRLTLAKNCHLIIIIFGFFFLIAGSILTALAYTNTTDDSNSLHRMEAYEENTPSRQEGKVTGPLFVVFGSILLLSGFILTGIAWKVNRDAKRQIHLSRLTWAESSPIQTPNLFNNSPTLNHHRFQQSNDSISLEVGSLRSRDLTTPPANISGNGKKSESYFTSVRPHQDLPTITRAVPVGVFLFDGNATGHSGSFVTSPHSPSIHITDSSGFEEIEIGPTEGSIHASTSVLSKRSEPFSEEVYKKSRSKSTSDGASMEPDQNDYNKNLGGGKPKANLGLRPSLPIIPMFAPPSSSASQDLLRQNVTTLDARTLHVSSRSDQPFGSIASLSTSGDIACFPITQSRTTTTLTQLPNTNNGETDGTKIPSGVITSIQTAGELSLSSSHKNVANQFSTGSSNINKKNNNDNPTSTTLHEGNSAHFGESRRHSHHEYIDNDYNRDMSNLTSTSSNNLTTGISELPPINVNEYGSKVESRQ